MTDFETLLSPDFTRIWHLYNTLYDNCVDEFIDYEEMEYLKFLIENIFGCIKFKGAFVDYDRSIEKVIIKTKNDNDEIMTYVIDTKARNVSTYFGDILKPKDLNKKDEVSILNSYSVGLMFDALNGGIKFDISKKKTKLDKELTNIISVKYGKGKL